MAVKSSTARVALLLLKQTASGFIKDDGPRLSAALAYYSAFSLAPLLLISVAIAGAVFGDEAVRGVLDDELRQGMGSSAASVVQDMIAHARKPSDNILVSLSGLVLLLFGAAGFFGQLQDALNSMWNIERRSSHGIIGLVKDRFLSFTMVLGTGFLLLVSMILTAVLQGVSGSVAKIASLPAELWTAGNTILSFGVISLLFAAIFKILPDAPVRWRDVWIGALFTSALFVTGKFAIGWYLGREATSSSYGSAAAVVLVLLWLHYSAMILLFGAEFTQNYSKLRGRWTDSQ